MDVVEGVGDVFKGDIFALGLEGGENDVARAGDARDVEGEGVAGGVCRVDGVARRVGGEEVERREGVCFDHCERL